MEKWKVTVKDQKVIDVPESGLEYYEMKRKDKDPLYGIVYENKTYNSVHRVGTMDENNQFVPNGRMLIQDLEFEKVSE